MKCRLSKTEYGFDGFSKWEKQLGKMIEEKYPAEFKKMVFQVASQVQLLAKEKTPVKSHHLQDGWEVGKIKKIGNEYFVEVVNNVDYAEFVNYGHRLKDGTYKEGVFMLDLALAEVEEQLPTALKAWLEDFIANNDL